MAGRSWETQGMTSHGGPLPTLELEGFEPEQVWEQIVLHHTPLLRHLRRQALNLVKSSEKRPHSFFPSVRSLQYCVAVFSRRSGCADFVRPPSPKIKAEELGEEEGDEDEAEEAEEDHAAEEGENGVEEGDENEEDDDDEEDDGVDEDGGASPDDSMNGSGNAGGEDTEDEDGNEANATEEGPEEEEDAGEEDDEDDKAAEAEGKKKKQKKTKSGDRFFNLDDMERFINEAEMEAERARDEEDGLKGDKDEESDEDDDEDGMEEDEEGALAMEMEGFGEDDDLEADGGEDEDDDDGEGMVLGGGIRYDQFFDAPEGEAKQNKKKGKGLEDTITQLEDKIVGSKPWQMRGEVNNRKRPLNSLLEEHVEFETVLKQAPVITEEVTMALEDIIKRRIIEGSFDDVVRKVEEELEHTHRAAPELDFQKSQKSLAEIYEEEYLKNVEKASAKPLGVVEEKKTKEQEEVLRRFAQLAYKLDALSNFHFTPKPVIPDISVKENVAAIRMEEIIPVGVSDASLLAPQEVFAPDKKANALPTADSDSAKKRRRKKRHAGSKPGDGMPKGKNIKRAERSADGGMTSTKLFKQLTQETQQAASGKAPAKLRKQDAAAAPKGDRKDAGFKL